MPKASARHILVKTEEACIDLKSKIEGGADFADMAKQLQNVHLEMTAEVWANSVPVKWFLSLIQSCLMMMWEKFMVRLKLNSDTILLRSRAEAK